MQTATQSDTTYNGHPSWEHWNVSLWINNDEYLYRAFERVAREYHNVGWNAAHAAASGFSKILYLQNIEATPDGAVYTHEILEYMFTERFEEMDCEA